MCADTEKKLDGIEALEQEAKCENCPFSENCVSVTEVFLNPDHELATARIATQSPDF